MIRYGQVIKAGWQRYCAGIGGQVSMILALICVPLLILLGAYMSAGQTAMAEASSATPQTAALTSNLAVRTVVPYNVSAPAYTYRAELTKVYDADTWRADVDLGFNTWRRDEPLRLYGLNAPEIKRSKSKGVTRHDVEHGFDCRDIMLEFLGLEPDNFARKAKFIEIIPPIPVVIQTIKDKQGKYGRMLAIIHKDGVNLNEKLVQSGCAKIEFYDG